MHANGLNGIHGSWHRLLHNFRGSWFTHERHNGDCNKWLRECGNNLRLYFVHGKSKRRRENRTLDWVCYAMDATIDRYRYSSLLSIIQLQRIVMRLESLSLSIVLRLKKHLKVILLSVSLHVLLLFLGLLIGYQVDQRILQLNLALIYMESETQLYSSRKDLRLQEANFYSTMKGTMPPRLGINPMPNTQKLFLFIKFSFL